MPELMQLVNEARLEIEEIYPADLKRMQQSGEDFVLLDVREPDEVAKGAIAGSIAIPRGMVEVSIDRVTTDKSRKIVLYCSGGLRSTLTAWMLTKMGFHNVHSLAGGYDGWIKEK